MKIYSWESKNGNFGDDLNHWIWPELIPHLGEVYTNYTLIGVGTILTQDLPSSENLVVIGSGAGYGSVPSSLHNEGNVIFGVRGPLTARIGGIEDSKVLSDPAILIPNLYDCKQSQDTKNTIFIPHVHNVDRCNWEAICKGAGVEYVSPCLDAKVVIEKIANASLVLAESMHAAIIADAYRVPWIPVWSTKEINQFKWLDWALGVGAKFEPVVIRPASPLAMADSLFSGLASNDNTFGNIIDFGSSYDDYKLNKVAEFARGVGLSRQSGYRKTLRRNYLRLRKFILAPVCTFIGKHFNSYEHRAINNLKKCKEMKGFLSSDETFYRAQDRLQKVISTINQLN